MPVGGWRRRVAYGVCGVFLVVATACAGQDTGPPSANASTVPTIPDAQFGTSSPLTLVVTNQSFERPAVDLVVTLNGATAVAGEFKVMNQHEFSYYSFDVPAGTHQVTVVGGDRRAEATIEVVGRASPRWLVISYWAEEIRTERFTSQPGFA